jgi:H+/Cl- antiporter ClcA
MINPLYDLFLGIGVIFGAIAALMAYLITYNEWMHHYPTKKKPRKMALEAAIFAFIFFFLMSLFSGYVLINFINK